MKYLDSNVFLYPILYEGKKSGRAGSILNEMVDGDIHCATASLTLDEVMWIISKKVSRDRALEVGRDILELPNLKVLDVTARDILRSIELMRKYEHLKPRDSIHAAVSLGAGIHSIVSDDGDFDEVEEIDRIGLD